MATVNVVLMQECSSEHCALGKRQEDMVNMDINTAGTKKRSPHGLTVARALCPPLSLLPEGLTVDEFPNEPNLHYNPSTTHWGGE